MSTQNILTRSGVQGVIFDCDGVLVDSEPLSCYALNILFERYCNVDIGTDYSKVIGKKVKDGIKFYTDKFSITGLDEETIQSMISEKDHEYMNLARGKLKQISGIETLIQYCLTSNLKIAVASSGTLDKITFNLTESGLDNYFSCITSSEEVVNGKPHPEIFLLSAEKLNLVPKQCLVIEDSIAGINAANAANMISVGVTNTFPKIPLIEAKADYVVDNVMELIK